MLDVANIVASGNTREFLAKKEKEKAEKGKAGKRGREKDADAAKAVRLPNSKRFKNTFHYEELVTEDVIPEPKAPAAPAAPSAPAAPATVDVPAAAGPPAAPVQENGTKDVEMTDGPATNGAAPEPSEAPEAPASTEEAKTTTEGETVKQENGEQKEVTADIPKIEEPETATEAAAPVPAAPTQQEPEAQPQPAEPQPEAEPEQRTRRVRRDIEVGLERFTFAQRNEIDRIVTAIYRAIQGVDDMYMRPQCWENLVFVGNGVRLRGLKDNIMQTLQARYLISPSTATMFTSELPSNLGTPSGTGSQTPTGSFTGAPHQLPTTSSVNPLLQAATTAGLAVPGVPARLDRTPEMRCPAITSIAKLRRPSSLPLPTYLTEWTKNGFEEAMFLGAQVAARLAFCVHNLDQQGMESQKCMSLNRVDYKWVSSLFTSLPYRGSVIDYGY